MDDVNNLIAYKVTEPNSNNDSFMIQLRRLEGSHGSRFYITHAGDQTTKVFLSDEEAYQFAHGKDATLCIELWGQNETCR
jgi:hypothetical protein